MLILYSISLILHVCLVGFIIWLFCFVKSKQQQNIKETRQLYLNKQFISHIQSCHIIFSQKNTHPCNNNKDKRIVFRMRGNNILSFYGKSTNLRSSHGSAQKKGLGTQTSYTLIMLVMMYCKCNFSTLLIYCERTHHITHVAFVLQTFPFNGCRNDLMCCDDSVKH